MVPRLSAVLALASSSLILAWSPEAGAAFQQGRSEACEFPVLWRIADIDPAFGLSADEAARAVRQAGMLWEAATGRVLMFQESSEGIPIRFIFDDRQRHTLARQEALSELDSAAKAVEEDRVQLEDLRSRVESRRASHRARLNSFEARLASHEELVESWNQRGGAPPAELERLQAAAAELEEERATINASADDVNRLVDEVNATTDRLNQRITEHNQAMTELDARVPPLRMQSGQLIEDVRGFGRLVLSRDIEIRIYQFESRDHLLQVVAHELGHAMGLEHSNVEGSLMGEEVVPVQGGGSPEIPESDARAILALCPALALSGG